MEVEPRLQEADPIKDRHDKHGHQPKAVCAIERAGHREVWEGRRGRRGRCDAAGVDGAKGLPFPEPRGRPYSFVKYACMGRKYKRIARRGYRRSACQHAHNNTLPIRVALPASFGSAYAGARAGVPWRDISRKNATCGAEDRNGHKRITEYGGTTVRPDYAAAGPRWCAVLEVRRWNFVNFVRNVGGFREGGYGVLVSAILSTRVIRHAGEFNSGPCRGA